MGRETSNVRNNIVATTDWQILSYKKQGVAVMGRNRTGPPCGVGRPTRPPAALQIPTDDDDRQQTPASKTILAHFIRRASNKWFLNLINKL